MVVVAGLYRTGKSFLLNLLTGEWKAAARRIIGSMLFAGHTEESGHGFQVGSTVNACTKGVWLWGNAIKNEEKVGNWFLAVL